MSFNLPVLVTGGAGFLGSFVVEALESRGIATNEIIIPRSSECDLTRSDATEALFQRTRPRTVIHLAAKVGGIGANRKHPGTFFRDNALMGLHVLEEARKHNVEKLVLAGTICAYPKFAPVPFREDDLWNGYPEETNAAYGIAKKSLHVMANAYRQEFGCNFVTVFPVNLYGPRDNFSLEDSHVVPAMIRKFAEARRAGSPNATLWGDGSPTREFLYVKDAAEGIVLAAEHYNDEAPVNLGSGQEISIKELSVLVASLTGFAGSLIWDAAKPNGQPRRMLDVARARTQFGFTAGTTMRDGLTATIEWYNAHRDEILARGR